MRLLYFAAIREALGRDEEEFSPDADVATVGQLVDCLAGTNHEYESAFAARGKLRFALDQQMVDESASLSGAKELAIFPPVTGG